VVLWGIRPSRFELAEAEVNIYPSPSKTSRSPESAIAEVTMDFAVRQWLVCLQCERKSKQEERGTYRQQFKSIGCGYNSAVRQNRPSWSPSCFFCLVTHSGEECPDIQYSYTYTMYGVQLFSSSEYRYPSCRSYPIPAALTLSTKKRSS